MRKKQRELLGTRETADLLLDPDTAKPESTVGPADHQSLSNTKKKVSSLLQSARTVVGALSDVKAPNPALARGIANLRQSMDELFRGSELRNLEDYATQLVEEAFREMPIQLKQFCESNGLHLGGALPDYVIAGTVYLRIDSKNFEANLNDDKHPLFPVTDFLLRIREEVSRYSSVGFEATRFLAQLWHAYQLCANQRKSLTKGERVSIFEILPELAAIQQPNKFLKNPTKENFRPYSQHMFRADLYRLFSSQNELVIEGFRLVVEPTSVAEDGLFMFLPSIGRCAFVGHIVFLPTEQIT